MKKILCATLVLALLCCLLPVQAFAATSGYYTYYVVDGEARIGKCDPSVSGNIVIPESLDGYPVQGILSYAFDGCTGLTGVTIPDSAVFMDDYVFRNCTNLTTVTIGKNLHSFGSHAFYNCTGLEEININAVALRDRSDGGKVFYNAGQSGEGITVNVDKAVTRIPSNLFYSKDSIAPKIVQVNFAEGSECTEIGANAFKGCSALSSFTIPEKIVTIGDEAFYGCTGLKQVNFNATAMNDLHTLNRLFTSTTKEREAIAIHIGKNVTRIPADLFHSTAGTTEASPRFSEVVFEEGSACREIANFAFNGVDGVTTIVIPEGVTYIGSYAFLGCSDLVTLSLPSSLSIYGPAFIGNCDKLEYHTYNNAKYLGNAENPYVMLISTVSRDFSGCKIHEDTKIIYDDAFQSVTGLDSLVIPEGMRQIGDYAFSSSDLAVISIPRSVQRIGISTFKYCDKLVYNVYDNGKYLGNPENPYMILAGTVSNDITQIDIHKDTTIIYHKALNNCTDLTFVAFPEGVERLGFWSCRKLTSVYIPTSVTTITEDAFLVSRIKNVYYGGSPQQKAAMNIYDANILDEGVTWHYNQILDPTGAAGDLTGDGLVTSDDVVQLLLHISMPDLFPITVNADYTGDGNVTSDDVVQLLLHISMPDLFPLG